MGDVFRTLRQLSAGATNIDRLDEGDCKTLESLGLVRLTESRHTDAAGQRSTIARLTGEGRSKLYEISTAGVTSSPVGARATAQLSDTALLSLHGLQQGDPPTDMASTALAQLGLVAEAHGICVLTRKGHDMLSSRWAQERLAAILNPHRRG